MAFNIADFKAVTWQSKHQKPNKFRVRIFLPSALIFEDAATARNLEFWAESVVFPMHMIGGGQAQRWGYGTPEYRHTLPLYDTVSVTLVADARGRNHQLFTTWLNTIATSDESNGPVGQLFEIGYRNDVVSEVEIDLFDEEGTLNTTVTLQEALPVAIGNVKLDWADNNNYMRLPIEFRFWKWIRTQGEA